MNRFAPWLIALSLAFSSVCFGQVIQAPIEAEPASLVTLESEHEGRWIPGTTFDASATDRFEAKVWPDRKSAVIAAGLPGSTRVVVLIPDDVAQNFVTFTIKAKGAPKPPVPPTPDPDDPDVDPEPPRPPPSPAPIPVAGLHVLIVYETGENLPSGQHSILYGEQVRTFLEGACKLYTDGTKAYRIYDQNVDASGDIEVWKNAMARSRASVPWLIVSNGKTGFEGPLPATPEEFISLVQKYQAN